MENEERKRTGRRKRRVPYGWMAATAVLVVVCIIELAVLLSQKKQPDETSGGTEELQAQLAAAQQEADALRTQMEVCQAERDAYLEQINQLTAGIIPADPAASGEVPAEDPLAVQPGEKERGFP